MRGLRFQLTVGDFNNDGFPDAVVKGTDPVTGAYAVGVMLGNGDGTFKATNVIDIPTANTPPVTGDFNNDGKIDIAVGGSQITVLPGNGNGTFGARSRPTNPLAVVLPLRT